MYNSDASQDQFAAGMLQFKNNGYYLDIGSCHSIHSNNSFFFDNNLDWKGICFEIEPSYASSYSTRKNCLFMNTDATNVDYKKLLDDNNFPKSIDYLSLDIDTLSLTVLNKLPLDEYRFKVITIEHDSYLYGDEYKGPQREILSKNGYTLICADVYVQQPGFNRENCSFEDWWVDTSEFSPEFIEKIKSEYLYPSQIIEKFKMSKLGIFYTCFDERKAIEYSLYELNKIYPHTKIYLVSEGIDFSYLEVLYKNLKTQLEEDTMSSTFKITDVNFIEEEHQVNIKKCALATLDRLERAIEYCNSEYILMMDPDSLVRGVLNIPDGVKLLGSRVNSGFPQRLKDALAKSGAKVINNWGATPAIFHSETFLKALNYLRNNMHLLDEFTSSFYAIYAHDVLLPILFALVGEEETFNPDIIECQRDRNWMSKTNPLVHQFREFYE